MRVAILAPGLAYDAGAIPIRARLAGNLLVKRGHEVIGLGLSSTRFRKVEADFPIETIHVAQLPHPLASLSCWLAYELRMAFRLIKLHREGPLDFVVSHWQTYGLTATFVCRWTHAKWVSLVQRTIYDMLKSGHGGRNWLMNQVILRGCQREFPRSSAVVVLHRVMMDEILCHVPQTRRVVPIPNGVHIGPEHFGELWGAKESGLVLYVGRLDPEKCVDVLISGFAQSQATLARLVIVGDGAQKRALQDLAFKLGISDRVNFVGELPHTEALDWMKRAAVFVLVSASEGMPFAMLEAMAAGCAIVSSNIAGNLAVVSEANAQIVPVGKANELAVSLTRLITDHDVARHCARLAFNRAKKFDWETILQEEVSLYEQIVCATRCADK